MEAELNENGKVYIHNDNGVCVARLCFLSGEVYVGSLLDQRTKLVYGESFARWRERVKALLDFDVPKSLRPHWDLVYDPIPDPED
jgi:hypothetical protein